MKVTQNTTSRQLRSALTPPRAATRTDNAGRSRFDRLLQTATATVTATPTPTTPASGVSRTATSGSIAAPSDSVSPNGGANVFGLVTPPQPVSEPSPAPTPEPVVDRPTAESVFGVNPWMSSAGGYSVGGGSYSYNSTYFATQETAAKVAQLLGGKVVSRNAMVGDTGPFYQTQANYMVELPNGHLVNPGLTATYYTHGWSQSFIDTMLGYDRNV